MSKKSKSTIDIEWRSIIINNFETTYSVSNSGKVMNMKNLQILGGYYDKDGYVRVNILVNGKWLARGVHRLVAEAFIPNPENKPQVNHKDAIKDNNWDWNLEWATPKENIRHSVLLGLNGKRGMDNPTSKYTDDQVRLACEMMTDPDNRPITIEQVTGISRIGLYNIRKGNIWTHISKDYLFPTVDFITGENNVNNVYSEEKIHEICKLLEDNPFMYPNEIARMADVPSGIVHQVRTKQTWRQISDLYEINSVNLSSGENHSQSVYSADQINEVCKLLENPNVRIIDIERATGVKSDTIVRIVDKEVWTNISQNYQFPSKRIQGKGKNPATPVILAMLTDGKPYKKIIDVIMNTFGLPDKGKAYNMVTDVKSRYITRSSTIPNTTNVEKDSLSSKEEVHLQANGRPLEELKVG